MALRDEIRGDEVRADVNGTSQATTSLSLDFQLSKLTWNTWRLGRERQLFYLFT
jgi:hypothetical protein